MICTFLKFTLNALNFDNFSRKLGSGYFRSIAEITTNRGEWPLANRHELSHFILVLAIETSKKVKEKYI